MDQRIITYKDTTEKARFGDLVYLKKSKYPVVRCMYTDMLMLNVDLSQLEQGDLAFIKKLGLTISNPDTKEPVALGAKTWKDRLSEWFDSDDEDDDDFFFSSTIPSSSSTLFGGASLGGISTGGFGGFGGGSFGGGGVTRGF